MSFLQEYDHPFAQNSDIRVWLIRVVFESEAQSLEYYQVRLSLSENCGSTTANLFRGVKPFIHSLTTRTLPNRCAPSHFQCALVVLVKTKC